MILETKNQETLGYCEPADEFLENRRTQASAGLCRWVDDRIKK